MQNLPDLIIGFFIRQTVQLFEREINKPDGWEADPRTKTIRRRKRPRPREANRRAANPRRQEVIDVCPDCFSVHKDGPCPIT